jgi:hypothetical protein
MAPIDFGAYALAATPHRVLAAPYHRNGAGNRAMYRFFLAPPDQAQAIARRWHIDYVATCPGDFDELGAAASDPRRLTGALRGRVPAWLRRLSPPGAAPALFVIVPRQ